MNLTEINKIYRMKTDSTAKQDILDALRKHRPTWNYEYTKLTDTSEYFVQPHEPLQIWFKKTLENLSGTCEIVSSLKDAFAYIKTRIGSTNIYCTDTQLQPLLESFAINYSQSDEASRTATYSLTRCEALVSRTASVLISSEHMQGRRPIASAEIHIVLAYTHQLHPDFPQALAHIENTYGDSYPSQITSITGPSRTADIEKTLVLGAHGPKELIVILIEE